MRRFLFTFLFCVACVSATSNYEGHKIFAVTVKNEEQANILQKLSEIDSKGVDFWTDVRLNAPIDIHVTKEQSEHFLAFLESFGIEADEKVSNLQDLVNNERDAIQDRRRRAINKRSTGVPFAEMDYTPNIEDLQLWMRQIEAMYDFASIETLGYTHENRPMELLKFATGGSDKKMVFLDCGIHAREWMTTASMIWIINEMALKYGTDDKITQFMDEYDFYLMPVANPDGYEFSQTSERFWRKNRNPNRGGCMGVDLNRNFDYPQFGGPSTSTNPCSDTYKGESGLSEPESQALSKFILENGDNIMMYINIHAYSELWFTTWGFTKDRPDDYLDQDYVAYAGADALYAVNGQRFQVGPPSYLLYAAGGGAYDWAKGTAGVKYSFSMELRPHGGSGFRGFLVDPAEVPAAGAELLAGILAALDEIELLEYS